MNYLSNSILSSSPSSVDKPNIDVMLLDLLVKEVSVDLRFQG